MDKYFEMNIKLAQVMTILLTKGIESNLDEATQKDQDGVVSIDKDLQLQMSAEGGYMILHHIDKETGEIETINEGTEDADEIIDDIVGRIIIGRVLESKKGAK